MTSMELKHKAKLKEWSEKIQECRSSELSVTQWRRLHNDDVLSLGKGVVIAGGDRTQAARSSGGGI